MEQERKAEALKMYAAGISIPAIATELAMSAQAIRNMIKTDPEAQAVKPVTTTREYNDVLVAEAYESGMSIPKILEEFGIRRPQLYSILSKFSTPTRKVLQENTRKRAMDEAISLYKQGVVIRQITADTGIHQPTLHAELAKRGIPMRRPRGQRT